MTKKKQIHLSSEEKETLEAFEKAFDEGKLKSVKNVDSELKRYQNIAQASGNKTKRVSLRMTEWDFNKAQVTALREGIPYQTLLASVIHKYLSDQLVTRKN